LGVITRGSFTVGIERFLPQIQHWIRELLAEDQFPLKLPEDAFVFAMHQGYTFNFSQLPCLPRTL
jgi:hypothetical protein